MKTKEELLELSRIKYPIGRGTFALARTGFIEGYKQCQQEQLNLHLVSKPLPTDDEIEKQADGALFGFSEARRKYDDDYYTGYQDGAKWIRDKRNES